MSRRLFSRASNVYWLSPSAVVIAILVGWVITAIVITIVVR